MKSKETGTKDQTKEKKKPIDRFLILKLPIR